MEKFQGRHVQQPEIAILKGMRKDISHIVRLQVSVKLLRPGRKMFLFMLLISYHEGRWDVTFLSEVIAQI